MGTSEITQILLSASEKNISNSMLTDIMKEFILEILLVLQLQAFEISIMILLQATNLFIEVMMKVFFFFTIKNDRFYKGSKQCLQRDFF